DVIRDRSLLDAFVGQLSDDELAYMAQGHPGKVIGECGNVGSMTDLGCYGLETVDGGAGVRLVAGHYTSCMPALMLVACSWNLGIVDKYCDATGKETALNNVDIWLAPGLNIHRNPLCGRNFEYFSEDPYITGMFAAKFVRCAHKYGYFSMIKHFCANNCETNRSSIDTRVNDRAMREIYMRGFQRAVEEGGALYIMSSYNVINGVEVAESKNIQTDILRGEWGFKGIVCTDWGNNSNNTKEVLAGNNVKMPSGNKEEILFDLAEGTITRAKLVENAKAIFNTLLQSHDYRMKAAK
ncbi:MAG: glycoside hydrolase family 3 protein, partial [Abditibacteriota bacterium]|nr:glycoside hydrolase family 3 protein [Abditibacteriota bacterium]